MSLLRRGNQGPLPPSPSLCEPAGSHPYDIRWCAACDFGFLDPRPPIEDPDRFNEPAAFGFNQSEQGPTFLEKLRLHVAWKIGHVSARQIDAPLIHSIVSQPTASICLFGCEDVAIMAGLRDLGHRVLGVERNDLAVRQARDQGLEVYSGTVDAPPREVLETSFDAVFLNRALQSSPEPRAALRNVHRLMNPRGHVFAEVANHGAYSALRLGPAWHFCDAGRNLNFFTRKSLSRLFESTDFDVKDILYRQVVPQFSRERMVAEQVTWDRLYGNLKRGGERLPSRTSTFDVWARLVRLIFQSPSERFEVLGIIATKRPS